MSDRDAIIALAEQALDTRGEAAAVPQVSIYCERHPDDVGVLHWLALLHRELDRRDLALPLLRRAAALAPDDVGVIQALAQVSLEAGVAAVEPFERAVALAPGRGDLRLSLAGARLAEGHGDRALDELATLLRGNPGWLEGHLQHAQLAALVGQPARKVVPLELAIAAHPAAHELHRTLVRLLLDAEEPAAARDAARRGLRDAGDDPALLLGEAAATDELGELQAAGALFARLGPSPDPAVVVRRVRHWLRSGAPERAAGALEPHLRAAGAEALWPYAALAWRLTGDPRAAWLDAHEALISVVDLDPGSLELERIRQTLGRLHDGSGRFLDQSVRGGTQTPGALFARIEPEIAALRETLRGVVARHVAALPAPDSAHPTLAQRRDRPIRFAGSWSVRLRAAGHHAAHHHPQGWLSSAFYVTVPPEPGDTGLLEIGGAPADLGISLAPRRVVEPHPGRLVLFPSWLWHATRPFTSGERMTIAFDVAPG